MILLPRGNSVKEKIDPGKVNLPDALGKLRTGGFTGYLRFATRQGTGILLFGKGMLINALFEGERERLAAREAIARLFELSLAGGACLDIYRLSADLAMSLHALLHGELRYQGRALRRLDVRALLARLKEVRFSGALRIYTDERIALIFYRSGTPLGFFHDGSADIETTADTARSVARLPGARLDVLTTRAADEQAPADLMESADLVALWLRSRELVARQKRAEAEAGPKGLSPARQA